jgi:hypothetical protein
MPPERRRVALLLHGVSSIPPLYCRDRERSNLDQAAAIITIVAVPRRMSGGQPILDQFLKAVRVMLVIMLGTAPLLVLARSFLISLSTMSVA